MIKVRCYFLDALDSEGYIIKRACERLLEERILEMTGEYACVDVLEGYGCGSIEIDVEGARDEEEGQAIIEEALRVRDAVERAAGEVSLWAYDDLLTEELWEQFAYALEEAGIEVDEEDIHFNYGFSQGDYFAFEGRSDRLFWDCLKRSERREFWRLLREDLVGDPTVLINADERWKTHIMIEDAGDLPDLVEWWDDVFDRIYDTVEDIRSRLFYQGYKWIEEFNQSHEDYIVEVAKEYLKEGVQE